MKKSFLLLIVLISVLALLASCTDGGSVPVANVTPAASLQPGETDFIDPDFTLSPELMEDLYPEDLEVEITNPIVIDDLMINEELDDDGWWNILLLGSDARYSSGHGRTDNIVILSVQPETRQAKLTSIMRDTWVNIYGVGHNKINTANRFGGPDLAIRTVNEYFDMNIVNYALVDMQSLVNIIDTVGGVELNISKEEKNVINVQLTYDAKEFSLNDSTPLREFGDNVHLTGNQALAYARIRHLDSDYIRTERQRNVLIAIAKKLQNSSASTLLNVITTLAGYVDTNLSLTEMMALANIGMSLDLDTVEQLRLPEDGTFTSGVYAEGVWCIKPDFEANQKILHNFIYGEK